MAAASPETLLAKGNALLAAGDHVGAIHVLHEVIWALAGLHVGLGGRA